jgi:xylulokinase
MSVMLSAAACLDWAASNLIGATDVPDLLALAEAADGETPIFLPYLTGERTPHADPRAQGVLFGLTAGTDRGAVARAVLEGVAMGLRDGLDVITSAGSAVPELTVAGGGSRSRFWGRLLASALGRPLVYRAGGDVGPAYGAARLARLAVDRSDIATVCAPPEVTAVVEPEADLARYFADRQPRFRALYTALKPQFQS